MEKPLAAAALLGLCLVSCDRKESPPPPPPETAPPAAETAVVEPVPPALPVAEPPQDFKIGEEEPGNYEPSPTPGQRLDHAIQKTEEGILKGAAATGEALRKTGEAIERKASGQ